MMSRRFGQVSEFGQSLSRFKSNPQPFMTPDFQQWLRDREVMICDKEPSPEFTAFLNGLLDINQLNCEDTLIGLLHSEWGNICSNDRLIKGSCIAARDALGSLRVHISRARNTLREVDGYEHGGLFNWIGYGYGLGVKDMKLTVVETRLLLPVRGYSHPMIFDLEADMEKGFLNDDYLKVLTYAIRNKIGRDSLNGCQIRPPDIRERIKLIADQMRNNELEAIAARAAVA